MSQSISSKIEELPMPWHAEATWNISTHKEESTFVFPPFGPAGYNATVKRVLENKQKIPTGEQIAFMLDQVYNSRDEKVRDSWRVRYFRNKVMTEGLLWIPMINVWTPVSDRNAGVYTIFDELGEGLTQEKNIVELEDRLSGGSIERGVRFSKDRKVAFSSMSLIKEGYYKPGTLSSDGAIIANYGIEGAEKLESVAKSFRLKPFSNIPFNKLNEPVQCIPALYRRPDILFSRLRLNFNTGDGSWGYLLAISGSENDVEKSTQR